MTPKSGFKNNLIVSMF